MTALWILAGLAYVGAIAAMMRSMASLPLPDRTEFDRAVHFRDLPEFARPPEASDELSSPADLVVTTARARGPLAASV